MKKLLERALVQDLAKTPKFRRIAKAYGLKQLKLLPREWNVPVGRSGQKGRIDAAFSSEAGFLLVEAQTGKSDDDHFERLAGYVKNFDPRNCLGIAWVAESFSLRHLYMCQTSSVPILPVRAVVIQGQVQRYESIVDPEEVFGDLEANLQQQMEYEADADEWKIRPMKCTATWEYMLTKAGVLENHQGWLLD